MFSGVGNMEPGVNRLHVVGLAWAELPGLQWMRELWHGMRGVRCTIRCGEGSTSMRNRRAAPAMAEGALREGNLMSPLPTDAVRADPKAHRDCGRASTGGPLVSGGRRAVAVLKPEPNGLPPGSPAPTAATKLRQVGPLPAIRFRLTDLGEALRSAEAAQGSQKRLEACCRVTC